MNEIERDGIILFVGDGCPACNVAKPIYHDFFKEQNQEYTMIDAKDEIELAQMLKIRGIPTLIFFKNGEEFKRIVGVPTKFILAETFDIWVDKDDFLAFD